MCCYRDRCNAHLLAHAASNGGSTNGNSGGRNNTDITGGGDKSPEGRGDGNTGKMFLLTFLHDMMITKFLIIYITPQDWITKVEKVDGLCSFKDFLRRFVLMKFCTVLWLGCCLSWLMLITFFAQLSIYTIVQELFTHGMISHEGSTTEVLDKRKLNLFWWKWEFHQVWLWNFEFFAIITITNRNDHQNRT